MSEEKGFWHKTKQVTENIWEGTKGVTEDAWEETKNVASDVKHAFSGDKEEAHKEKEQKTSCHRNKHN